MIDINEVKKMAQLAKLDLSPEEQSLFAAHLQKILQHMEQLKRLDTASPVNESPAPQPVLRPDQAQRCDSVDLLKNAPQLEKHAFVVPHILDGGS